MRASRLRFAQRKSTRQPSLARQRTQWLRGLRRQKRARRRGKWTPACAISMIVGADTTVELEGEIFGKPRDSADARAMLAKLSGRTHHVLTGIFVLRLPDNATRAAVENSAVTFAPLDEKVINAYAATGEPIGKAGAYAIQGLAGRYIPRIEGCYFNVVGLPLARLYALLRELGWREEK